MARRPREARSRAAACHERTQRAPACGGRPLIAGVDGCRGGWIVATAGARGFASWRDLTLHVAPTWTEVINRCRGAARIAVDMPIGLLDAAEPGGRPCDRAARRALGRRSSAVFSPPVRGVLAVRTYAEALAASRASSPHALGLSKQTWNLVPKIRELDEWMTPRRQRRVREVHPELVFATLNGGPVDSRKKDEAGRRERLALLGFAEHRAPPIASAAADDVIDALACLDAARRAHERGDDARPRNVQRDSRGLVMEIGC